MNSEVRILRDLAERFKQASLDPKQDKKRVLWEDHHSLKKVWIPVIVYMGDWDALGSEILADLECKDPVYREAEFKLKCALFKYEADDDQVIEPWIGMGPYFLSSGWGVEYDRDKPDSASGAYNINAVIQSKEDMCKLIMPGHAIDEQKLKASAEKAEEAIGDIITIDRNRGNAYLTFSGDISTTLGQLLGMEGLMRLLYDDPDLLHELAKFLYEGISKIYDATDEAKDWTLTTWTNHAMPYCAAFPRPKPLTPTESRKIWGFFSAQEFALISPKMHEEFLLRYQLPLMERFGLISYGCCEDLTNKIDMLKQIPNLRRIGISPWADIAKCAEQIQDKYVFSWRPNPATNVCYGWDPDLIRKTTDEALKQASGCIVDIMLKDVQTLQGENWRVAEWVKIIREIAAKY